MQLEAWKDQLINGISFRGSLGDHELNSHRMEIGHEVRALVASSITEKVMEIVNPKLDKMLKELFNNEE